MDEAEDDRPRATKPTHGIPTDATPAHVIAANAGISEQAGMTGVAAADCAAKPRRVTTKTTTTRRNP